MDTTTESRVRLSTSMGWEATLPTSSTPTASGKVIRKLAHIQVWTALQLMHLEAISPEAESGPVWIAGDDEAIIIYLPKTDAATLTAFEKTQIAPSRCLLMAAELVSQHVGKAISVRPIPQFLMERFGLNP